PGHVTLIASRAHDRVGPRADPRLARVALRAGVSVVAPRPVCRIRVRAGARLWIARPRHVALIERRAGDVQALAGVPETVAVRVGLTRVRGTHAVVADIAHAVEVRVGLIVVRDRD